MRVRLSLIPESLLVLEKSGARIVFEKVLPAMHDMSVPLCVVGLNSFCRNESVFRIRTADDTNINEVKCVQGSSREKASEAWQFTCRKKLFDAKTVFPFSASGTGVVSPLPYAVVDSATLRNLKEAPVIRTVEPFTGADLRKHRIAEYRDGGLSFNTIRHFTAPACWPESAPRRNYPGQLMSADTLSAFYLTGCGLHCRRLC